MDIRHFRTLAQSVAGLSSTEAGRITDKAILFDMCLSAAPAGFLQGVRTTGM